MKTGIKLILILLIDVLLISKFVKSVDPDPSSSLLIIIYVPVVVILNIFICIGLAILKNNNTKYFFINALVSAILMFYFFNRNIEQHQKERIESWTFKIQDTTFLLTHWKLEHTFSLGYTLHQGSSNGYIDGKVVITDNEFILKTDTSEFYIQNNHLINFRKSNTPIMLNEIN